jgi:transcriptional regulator with XRE-family HTH domain
MASRYEIEIKRFGENVKKWRKERGMTQEQLAEKAGVPRPNLSKIESGQLNVEFNTIVKIADALEITTNLLFH